MSAIPPTAVLGRFAKPGVKADPCTSAFDSTEAATVSTLKNLQPISRALLTFLHIDPSLVRQDDRDRLRILVKLVANNPGNDLIGNELNHLRMLWARGFPVGAFDDDSRALLDVSEATRLVVELRTCLGSQCPDDERERALVNRLMRLSGYDD
ncbi:hypothetical protein ACVWWJ_002695 [Luteibacter sp. HA06]